MHSLNKFFDHIYCINLINETERKEKVKARFDKLGIEVEFFPAIKYGFLDKFLEYFKENTKNGHDFKFTGEVGCAISHYSCIKTAKELGYKSVLIFEDDVTFLKNFNDIIQSYLDIMPDDWDVIYLYSGLYKWTNDHYWIDGAEFKIFTSSEVNGCIAYALRDKFYDVYLEKMDQSFQITDNFCSRLQKLFKYHFYSVVPNLCAQEINHSTINPNTHAIINVFPHMKTFKDKNWMDYE